jgi:hypothetical protein
MTRSRKRSAPTCRRLQVQGPDDTPDGAVFVGRPTKWGNPFKPGESVDLLGQPIAASDRGHSQVLFIAHLALNPRLVAEARRELAGKDLACSCDLHMTCHASVWLRKAAA